MASWLDDAKPAAEPSWLADAKPVASGIGDLRASPAEQIPVDPKMLEPEKPGLLRRAANHVEDLAAGMLPPTAGPLGMLADAVSGGRYGKVAPRYGGIYQPETPDTGDVHTALIAPGASTHFLPIAALASFPGGKGKPLLEKSPAARTLEAQGVKNLTVGQMAPESTLGQIEAVSTHSPLGMQAARDAAKESWRLSEIRKAVNPADKTPLPGDVQAAMADAYGRFGPEYDAIRQVPVPGQAVSGMPQAAVATPKGIDARTIAGARKEIENALTVLPQAPKPPTPSGLLGPNGQPLPPPPAPPPPNMTAGDLMKVRSVIRDEMRTARKAQDFDRLNQLGHAHDVVTQTLEQNLPTDAQAALRGIDQRYSTLMTLEHASPAGQTNFTPNQLLRSAEHSAGRRAFKQGDAALQTSGEAAREAFTDAPMTGFRGAVLSSVPGLSYAAGPIARVANSQIGKRLLFETPSITSGLHPGPWAPAEALAEAMRKRGPRFGLEPIPTTAEDDR